MGLGKKFADEISLALRQRRIGQGIALLEPLERDLAKLDPHSPDAAGLLLLIAQWVDAGFRDHHFLDELLGRFPKERTRETFPPRLSAPAHGRRLSRVLRRRARWGYRDLRLCPSAQNDVPDPALAALAHFWIGRAQRKKGEYEASFVHIASARELAQASHDRIFAAVIQIQESWLIFQKGQHREALRVLAQSESVLKATDHWIALGQYRVRAGRIVRRAGDYGKALEHFRRSIEIYAQGDPHHANLARALVNCASTRRLLGSQILHKLDTMAKSSQSGSPVSPPPAASPRETLPRAISNSARRPGAKPRARPGDL